MIMVSDKTFRQLGYVIVVCAVLSFLLVVVGLIGEIFWPGLGA